MRMRIVGEGVWGPPKDHGEAIAVLQRLAGLGIDFIDTADSYGPEISERLIAEALHPYKGLFIATKGGLVRPGQGVRAGGWAPVGCRGRCLAPGHGPSGRATLRAWCLRA